MRLCIFFMLISLFLCGRVTSESGTGHSKGISLYLPLYTELIAGVYCVLLGPAHSVGPQFSEEVPPCRLQHHALFSTAAPFCEAPGCVSGPSMWDPGRCIPGLWDWSILKKVPAQGSMIASWTLRIFFWPQLTYLICLVA